MAMAMATRPQDHRRVAGPCAGGPPASTRDGYRPRRVTFGVVYLVVGIAFLLDSLHAWTVRAGDIWPLALIALGTSMLMGRRQRARVEEDRTSQLAVAEERVRIARELHDIVAHSVSLMTIQIAAARRVGKNQPEAADQALAAAEQTGRQSLVELRGMLSMLRGVDASIEAAGHRGTGPEPPDGRRPLPGLADLESLVAGARDAGLDVRLRESGTRPESASGVGLTVYRVVQEALTNAIRHAGPAAHVQAEVTYAPGFIIVFVDDDGTGAGTGGARPPVTGPAARTGDGHGLVGMRERVEALGGTMEAGPRSPGPGWRVHARIPTLPETP
ncbi:MAG TPA: histidine kinase [Acidimicrobiales bacterium]|nr:histidine kinase [Acidimicrobiales bacterium]